MVNAEHDSAVAFNLVTTYIFLIGASSDHGSLVALGYYLKLERVADVDFRKATSLALEFEIVSKGN